MEEEFINEDEKCKYEEHSYYLLFWRNGAENDTETRTFECEPFPSTNYGLNHCAFLKSVLKRLISQL